MVAVEPSVMLPNWPMAWVALVVTPPLAVPEMKIAPAGRVSVTTTFKAVSGPRLVTVMVKVRLLPTKSEAGVAVNPIARSLLGSMEKVVLLLKVPAGVVTVMKPLLEPAGTMAWSVELDRTVKLALTPLNFTAVAPRKFCPEIRTVVVIGPLVGEKLEMVEGKKKLVVVVLVPN